MDLISICILQIKMSCLVFFFLCYKHDKYVQKYSISWIKQTKHNVLRLYLKFTQVNSQLLPVFTSFINRNADYAYLLLM